MAPTETASTDRRQILARNVVLIAMMLAFAGAMLGVVVDITFGNFTGPEA